VFDSGVLSYSAAKLTTTMPGSVVWTHLQVSVTPARYTATSVELAFPSMGIYRDDPLLVIKTLQADAAEFDMPLLRVREAAGIVPTTTPKVGDKLPGPWLQNLPGKTTVVYRELLANAGWLRVSSNVTTMFDSSPTTGVFAIPDSDGWDRFNTRNRNADPANAGAMLLLEYGEVGSNRTGGPTFLVGLWAPARQSSVSTPAWRDMGVFIHPSTAKTWYPPVAYPFGAPYPYGVGDNTTVPAGDPDRIWQPYVNLALKYLFGEWGRFYLAGNEAVWITPIFPNSVPQHPDDLEYGLPLRTPSGLARLLAEVNLYLHRIRYGFSGTNLDQWWGARTLTARTSSSVDAKAPPLRRTAVAAYSAATPQLDALLVNEPLRNQRYPVGFWGVPAAVLDQFQNAWLETWCLDLLADSTTVLPATFEDHLKRWVDAKSARSFYMGGSGTTGHTDPDAHYPMLSKASAANLKVQSSIDARRHAAMWRGPGKQWTAVFCSNPYLSAAALDTKRWPVFPVAPSPDDAHGFMFRITSGFILASTNVGVP
jgi:hypothetical protein